VFKNLLEYLNTYMLGIASKTPFKRQWFKGPQTTTPVRAFFKSSLLFICACVETKKLARTGNRLPQAPVLPAT
jgi:hypothetical protein